MVVCRQDGLGVIRLVLVNWYFWIFNAMTRGTDGRLEFIWGIVALPVSELEVLRCKNGDKDCFMVYWWAFKIACYLILERTQTFKFAYLKRKVWSNFNAICFFELIVPRVPLICFKNFLNFLRFYESKQTSLLGEMMQSWQRVFVEVVHYIFIFICGIEGGDHEPIVVSKPHNF